MIDNFLLLSLLVIGLYLLHRFLSKKLEDIDIQEKIKEQYEEQYEEQSDNQQKQP